jgi:Zn-dependent protease
MRAAQRALVTMSRQRSGFGKNPDGLFFVLPTSHGLLWRPTGVVLAQSYSSSPFGGGQRGGGNRWAAGGIGLIGAASVLLGKSKYLLGALKLTKLASLGSMVFTIGTYSMFFGLPYAAGMVGLILVHETGHALVMRQRGVDFSPMVFVPFVGAFIAMRNQPRDAYEDALIAFGGPVLGGAGAGAVALAATATQSQLLFALADFGFMINLFNLLPIGAMDGGRIASALSPYAGVAGLGLGGVLAYSGAIHNPIFYLILLAGGWETFQRFYNPGATPPNYYRITPLQRAALTTSYFGLVAALMAGMAWNHRYQKPPEVLIRERQRELSWDMR